MNIVALGIVGVPILLLIGVPALLGFIFGARALGEIRESAGRKRGLGRAMFGTLSCPLLILILFLSLGLAMGFVAMFGTGLLWLLCATAITVAVGVLIILGVWRWSNGIPRGVRSHQLEGTSRSMGPVVVIAGFIVLLPTLMILVTWGTFTLKGGNSRSAINGYGKRCRLAPRST